MKLFRSLVSLVALAGLVGGTAFAQNRTSFAGEFRAVDFAYGVGVSNVSPLRVDQAGISATGTATLSVAIGRVTLADGTVVTPLTVGVPVTVGSGANQETVTPTAVSCSTPQVYQSCNFTASFSNQHGTGDQVQSATFGLDEAIEYANTYGNPAGGIVITDGKWYQAGGTKAIMVAVALATPNVWVFDTSGKGPVWYGKSGVTTAVYSALANDQSFQVTLAAGTATKTLSQTYAVAPSCVGTYKSGTATGILTVAPTTTTVVVTDSVSEINVVQVSCQLQK